MIRSKFEKIKPVQRPALHKTWMCSKMCYFGKTTFENTSVSPIEEYRDNRKIPVGQNMTKCEQVHHDIQMFGMNEVVDQYKHPDHSFGFYKAPGETN